MVFNRTEYKLIKHNEVEGKLPTAGNQITLKFDCYTLQHIEVRMDWGESTFILGEDEVIECWEKAVSQLVKG